MDTKTVPHILLKEELRRRKIRLWMIRNLTNVPESKLSRYINGIDPMPRWVEQLLWKLISITSPSHVTEPLHDSPIDKNETCDND